MKIQFPSILRALRSRNYRLFLSAQAVSQIGLWMQKVAMGWLVYRLTGSPRALGLTDFMSSFPILLLMPITSYLLPRLDLKVVLQATQALLMFSAAILGLLTLTGVVTYTWLLCVALFIGMINAFDMPVRQSIVVKLVDNRSDVGNAVALNSSIFNVARLIGPTVAGVTIHQVGEGLCFMINAIGYSATILAVKFMNIKHSPADGPTEGTSVPKNIKSLFAGFQLLREFPPFAHVLSLVLVASVFGVPYLSLMPAMTRAVLGGTSKTMGMLLMAVGIGALTGSLVMAARKSPVGLDRWVIRCCVCFGAFVALFAISRSVPLAMLALAPVGFFMVTTLIAANTFLQTFVDDRRRASLMSIYVATQVGIAPIGSMMIGQLGEWIGTSGALCASGLVCVIASLYTARKLDSCRKMILRTLHAKGYNLKEGRRWEQ